METGISDEHRYRERKIKRPRLERTTSVNPDDDDDDDDDDDRERTHKVNKSCQYKPPADSSSRESNYGLESGKAQTTFNVGMHDLFDSLEDQEEEVTQARGRTPERADHSPCNSRCCRSPGSSRASSSSSVRTMIDERLEWAHQDRMRSASQARPVQQSPFNEYSPFYAEYGKDKGRVPLRRFTFVCECCPEEPKEFDNDEDLEIHKLKKKYSCIYCPEKILSKIEADRHLLSKHGYQESWSCASLHNDTTRISKVWWFWFCCGYDAIEPKNDDIKIHLECTHRFGECDKAKRFFDINDFRDHLFNFHRVNRDTWFDNHWIEAMWMELEPPPQQRSLFSGDCDSSQELTRRLSLGELVAGRTSSLRFFSTGDTCVQCREEESKCDGLEPCGRCIWHQRAEACTSHESTHDAIPSKESNPSLQTQEKSETPAALLSAANGLSESPLFADSDSLQSLPSPNRQCDDRLSAMDVDRTAVLNRLLQSMSGEGSRNSDEVSNLAEDYLQAPNAHRGLPRPSEVTQSHLVGDVRTTMISPATSTPASEGGKQGPPFVCSTCQREFTRRTILINHERTHTGEKPFSCTFEGCIQAFAQQGDMIRHAKAHSTEKIFRCGSSQDESPSWGCGKKFRRKDGLLEHHSKTKKGKQCLTDRDKLAELGRLSNEDSLAFS